MQDLEQQQPAPVGTEGRGLRARWTGWLWGAAPVLLAGASLGVTVSELLLGGRTPRAAAALGGLGYALVVLVLVRTFPVRSAAKPLAGLCVGALPFALVAARQVPASERLDAGLGLALFGALVGCLEAARGARS